MKITIDSDIKNIIIDDAGRISELSLFSDEAFELLSDLWLKVGWNQKYVYTFSWMGRPIIQLPEDMLRMQEVLYIVKPDVIIETGVAHGGSLIYYASLCKLFGKGRVIGIDIEIRPHNRTAIEQHELYPYITLIEGSSTAKEVINKVKSLVKPDDTVLVILDSNHTKQHVLGELYAYCGIVTPESYIVACDGIMKDLVGAPRSNPDWDTNNPYQAAREFLTSHPEFELVQPEWSFNESNGLSENIVTYWPGAWLRRK